MHETLFRGKHIHAVNSNSGFDGKWIYGYLCSTNYIYDPELEGEMLIDPETVGQWTGLIDKNGNKIFEGDIVKAGSDGFIANCEVKRRIDGIYYMNPNIKTVWYIMPNANGETTVEIIGNIHDNPDLLKGEDAE